MVSFGDGTVHGVAQEGEVVAEDRVRKSELLLDVHAREHRLEVALVAVELDREAFLRMPHDAAELVDEVHVPGGAAELAVGGHAQPDVLLHLHGFADRLVLDRTQLVAVDAPRGVVLAGLKQRRWAEQAAHVVGAKRR